MKNTAYYKGDICCLKLQEEDGRLKELSFCSRAEADAWLAKEAERKRETIRDEEQEFLLEEDFQKGSFLEEACRQLEEYFSGQRQEFTLPLEVQGTEFQKKIWAGLSQIPYGTTVSYGELARFAGNPKAARAAGMAVHRNPIAVILPCHRVIGADGSLTGFGGGLEVKKQLLELEAFVISEEKKNKAENE